MGDVNCDILKPQLDSRSRKLEFLSSFYQFGPIIDCPTRATETSATAIDLIFSDRVENSLQAGTVDFRISHHSLIFPVRKCRIYKSQKSSSYFRSFKRFSTNDFLNDLSQVPWETVAQHDKPNVCWLFPGCPRILGTL